MKRSILSISAMLAMSVSPATLSADIWSFGDYLSTGHTTISDWDSWVDAKDDIRKESNHGYAVTAETPIAHVDDNGMIVADQKFSKEKSNGMYVPDDTQKSVTIEIKDPVVPPQLPDTPTSFGSDDDNDNDGDGAYSDSSSSTGYRDDWGNEVRADYSIGDYDHNGDGQHDAMDDFGF